MVMASFTGEKGDGIHPDFCWIGIIYLRNTRQMESFTGAGRCDQWRGRWKTGMDEDVAQERRENRGRICGLLIGKMRRG